MTAPLTAEQIESWRKSLKGFWHADSHADADALCDLALSALGAQQPEQHDAWLIPTIIDVYGAERTSLPREQWDLVHGTVAWHAEMFCDDFEPVTDKHGVKHYPKKLFAAQPEPGKWRPIETAPKDGTTITLWAEKWERPANGGYNKNVEVWDTELGCTDDGEAWPDDELPPPTHWQPLPSPPESKGTGA